MSEVVYPCPEKDWETLDGQSNESRFCKLCLKKVYAQKRNETVYCGVDRSTGMSYRTFLARFTVILFFVFGSALFTNAAHWKSVGHDPIKSSAVQDLSGVVRGKIIDGETKEELVFVPVILWQAGNRVSVTQTDLDGKYRINAAPGEYELEVSYVGYETPKKMKVVIERDKITVMDISMEQNAHISIGIIIEEPYRLEDHRSKTFKRKEIQRSPRIR